MVPPPTPLKQQVQYLHSALITGSFSGCALCSLNRLSSDIGLRALGFTCRGLARNMGTYYKDYIGKIFPYSLFRTSKFGAQGLGLKLVSHNDPDHPIATYTDYK